MLNQMTLVRGLPGSGKSTLARQLRNGLMNRVHFEADMYFVDPVTQVYKFNMNNLHDAHMWCQEEVDNAMYYKQEVIVSNTFTTIRELRPYFEIAKRYGCVPSVILVQNQFKNVHDVPEEVLEKMKQRFAYDISPLFKEYNAS